MLELMLKNYRVRNEQITSSNRDVTAVVRPVSPVLNTRPKGVSLSLPGQTGGPTIHLVSRIEFGRGFQRNDQKAYTLRYIEFIATCVPSIDSGRFALLRALQLQRTRLHHYSSIRAI